MISPSNPYSGYGLDPTGMGQEQTLQNRQRLVSALMQPSHPSNTAWGGLANAGSAISGALMQRGLNNQQNQIYQNNYNRMSNAPPTAEQ